MAKIYGALELAQLEWFTNAAKPAAASFIYRVIYVSDLKQIQVSDGTNWIPFLNTSTNQTLSGDITFSGQQIFNGLHRLSVTTNSATGAITALAPTTPITEFTGAVTSVSGVTSGASGATVMFINRSGSPFTVLDEDTGATAGNRIRTGTGASITLTNNASIMLSYAGDSRWHVVGGTGSSASSGMKNYFSTSLANPNFSQNSVSPWSACTLTFSSGVPSGVPTLTATRMAISSNGTNPLVASQSSYNLQLVKSAGAAPENQGFISGELTIDREDLAKVLTGSFSYEVASGTVDFSGTSTQSLEIWIYNTVNGAWTQPAGYRGMNTSSGTGIVTFTFQTDSTAANNKYKIAVITQQTSTTAYTVNFNDFKIGPTAVINGTPVTDWVSYTPTLKGTTSDPTLGTGGTITGKWRRLGDSIQIQCQAIAGTSPGNGSGFYYFTLPSGFVLDVSKLSYTAGSESFTSLGSAGIYNSGVTSYAGYPIPLSGVTTGLGIGNGSSSIAQNYPVANWWTATDVIQIYATVPVVGWSSNVQISADTDTRVVAMQATGVTSSLTASYTTAIFGTVNADTHGAYSPTTGIYTVPVSGVYSVSSVLTMSSSSASWTCAARIVKGSTAIATTQFNNFTSVGQGGVISSVVQCNAGDQLKIEGNCNGTSPGYSTLTNCSLSINRLSGPSVVAASETVALRYTNTAGSSYGTTDTLMPFATKDYDTHNAWVTNTFTAPISGKYLATMILTSGSTGIVMNAMIYKNGSSFCQVAGGYSTGSTRATGSATINLNAGDTVSFYVSGSVAGSLSTTAGLNHFSIVRVGN